jgi:serine phosphatase RsbU (regulator of sigma subunit)
LYYAVQPNTITKTIPDLVNILHAFWRIQRIEKFNKLVFLKWMEQQGKRQPFYAFFRKIPYIQHLQRDLYSTFAAIQDKALNGDIHDTDFNDELNNLNKLIEAHFKANDDIQNEFPDDQLSFESLRPEIPNSTSINHDINKRSPAPIFPLIAAATFASIAGAGIATLANTGSYLYNA